MNRIFILLTQLSDKRRVLLVEMNLEITYFKDKELLLQVILKKFYLMRKVQVVVLKKKSQMMIL